MLSLRYCRAAMTARCGWISHVNMRRGGLAYVLLNEGGT